MKPYEIKTSVISHIQIVDIVDIPNELVTKIPVFMIVCKTGLIGYYLNDILPLQNETLTFWIKEEDFVNSDFIEGSEIPQYNDGIPLNPTHKVIEKGNHLITVRYNSEYSEPIWFEGSYGNCIQFIDKQG